MDIPEHLVDPTIDYYAALELPPNATVRDVNKARKVLSLRYHPDRPKTGDEERFKLVQRAHEILSDPVLRSHYDNMRHEFLHGITKQTLGGFVFDSLKMFQEKLHILIPPAVWNEFEIGVKFVYETWEAIKTGEREQVETVCHKFGAFQLNKRLENEDTPPQ